MTKEDLQWAFEAMIEARQEIAAATKAAELLVLSRDEDFEPFGHIGHLQALLTIAEIKLASIIETATGK
tara:strand:+ start:2548 stop:2754 length:207 start_codon:yes stop_codon:yes gene_type:complete